MPEGDFSRCSALKTCFCEREPSTKAAGTQTGSDVDRWAQTPSRALGAAILENKRIVSERDLSVKVLRETIEIPLG